MITQSRRRVSKEKSCLINPVSSFDRNNSFVKQEKIMSWVSKAFDMVSCSVCGGERGPWAGTVSGFSKARDESSPPSGTPVRSLLPGTSELKE